MNVRQGGMLAIIRMSIHNRNNKHVCCGRNAKWLTLAIPFESTIQGSFLLHLVSLLFNSVYFPKMIMRHVKWFFISIMKSLGWCKTIIFLFFLLPLLRCPLFCQSWIWTKDFIQVLWRDALSSSEAHLRLEIHACYDTSSSRIERRRGAIPSQESSGFFEAASRGSELRDVRGQGRKSADPQEGLSR